MNRSTTLSSRSAESIDGVDIAEWEIRMREDRTRALRHQSPKQRRISATLLERALVDGAEGFALTGSTARGCRTEISDLDYHVVGRRPRCDDLPADIDIYVTDSERFWIKLREGDDMVQWTLRFGCILHDSGIFREGAVAIARERLWPDPLRHMRRLPAIVRLVDRLIEMGDADAAVDQLRAGLTLRARASLLAAGVFPLARSELPGQLKAIGGEELAARLSEAIHRELDLDELSRANELLSAPWPADPTDVKRTETDGRLRGRIAGSDRA